MKDHLRHALLGSRHDQEFVCASGAASVVVASVDSLQYRTPHVLLGYKPVLIALPELGRAERVGLSFGLGEPTGSRRLGGFTFATPTFAQLALERLPASFPVPLFVARWGKSSLCPLPHRLTRALAALPKRSRPGNVTLPGNLAEQVRIAYGYPRPVSVGCVATQAGTNFFPLDLHGAFAGGYLNSFRLGARSLAQVEAARRLVIADVPPEAAREVYALGPQHMRDGMPFESPRRTARFGWPLPDYALGYRELTRVAQHDVGIHRLSAYRVEHEVESSSPRLEHIHAYYAAYRDARGLTTTYFRR